MFSLGLGVPIRSLIAIKSPLQRSRPRHRTPRRAAAEESSCRQGTSSSPSWTRRRPEEEGRAQLPAVGRAAARQERHHRDDGSRHDVREDRRVRGGPDAGVLQGVQTLQELHNLAAPGGGVYRLQRSAARPRCKLTIVPTWSGRRSRLLLVCSAEGCCSTLSRLQLTIQHPAHREDGPEEAREERGQRLRGPGEGHGHAAQLPEEHGIKAWFCDMISSIFHTFTPSIVSAINASFTMFLCVRLLDTET